MEVFKGTWDLKGYSQAIFKQHLSPSQNMEEREMLTFVSRGPQNQPTWPCGGPEMLLCMVANSTLTRKEHVGYLLCKKYLNPVQKDSFLLNGLFFGGSFWKSPRLEGTLSMHLMAMAMQGQVSNAAEFCHG